MVKKEQKAKNEKKIKEMLGTSELPKSMQNVFN